jgi:putative PEP-CTERM system histidine kinase
MSNPWYLNPAAWSYGLAAVAFGVFSVQMAAAGRGRKRAALLLATVVLSSAWAASALVFVLAPSGLWWRIGHVFDGCRLGAALAFLLVLMMRATARGEPLARAARVRIGLLIAFVALTVFVAEPPLVFLPGEEGMPSVTFAVLLLRSILGLVLVERLFRHTQPGWRWNVRPLCLGLAGIFLYDLVTFADALLYRAIDLPLWTGRGIVNALVIPLLGLAAARNRDWNLSVTVSRSMLAGSTALLASGVYLLAVAAGGYYVRYFGGSWGRALEIVLLFAGVLALGLVLLSGTFRSKLRVLISKHFFVSRYDYRDEWLKITRTLSEATATSTPQLCIRALGDLVESTGGALWLKRDVEGFVPEANLHLSNPVEVEPLNGQLAEFIGRTGWVIDLDAFRRNAATYPGLVLPQWLATSANAWLVIPLPNGEDLIGFVVLAHPRVRLELNWEVFDLLKTAACQAASYLAMNQANDALLEARKFDAFNRMSAFVVHDLKNLIAQLQLLLRNNERHSDNRDFQRDMLSTVEHCVARMNHLMLQLRAGVAPVESPQAVDLATIARQVQGDHARGRGKVELELDLGVYVVGHQERLERVVGHLVQNAFDATTSDPRIRIRVYREAQEGVVEVVDNGAGMSLEFIRERLFRPFQSTKPMGMGIGAYESLQYVSALRGRITVDSNPGHGTTVRVRLPLAVSPQLQAAREEAA